MNEPASWLLTLGQWWTGVSPALRNAMPDSLFDALGLAFRHDEHGGLSTLVDGSPAAWYLDPQLVHLLHALAHQGAGSWPAPLSGRVLRRIEAALPALPQPWTFRQLLSSLSLALDPATATGAANWSDSGAPSYDHANAAAFTAMGIPCFACTPDLFPDLMAAAT